ncbi:hypothetical protein [Enterovibrio calviensis]|uniref:hypothetical protein n=1 Tax=Enterovibrio calviensis TaxID=91359 RepID=UPI000A8E1A50|nr:hypothetical protein [Enterovibrio calviensis]
MSLKHENQTAWNVDALVGARSITDVHYAFTFLIWQSRKRIKGWALANADAGSE